MAKTKGADQLRGYREADLRLFFAYAKIGVSHDAAPIISLTHTITILGPEHSSLWHHG